MIRRLLGTALTAVLLAACTPAAPSPAPPPVPTETPLSPLPNVSPSPRLTASVPSVRPPGFTDPPADYTAQSLSWQDCRKGLQCVTVRVPLDWDDLDGPALTLAMSRRPARTTPTKGVLFVNPGGPGASGLDMPRTLPTDGLAGFDIVGWDPRGVGESTPVRCLDGPGYDALYALDSSPDDATEVTALREGERTLGTTCLRRSGTLLAHVSTVDTVRDLDLLRQLLSAPTLNFYGASYGTVIGQLYAQLFPARTGRLVLDGAVVLGEDGVLLQTQGFDDAFDRFATWCAAQRCSLGATQDAVITATTSLLRRLDTQPIMVGDRQLTQSLAVGGIIQPLYGDASNYPLLARIIAAGVSGDGAPLLAVADAGNDRSAGGSYGQLNAAFPTIRCLDEGDQGVAAALADARRAAAAAPGFGEFLGPDLVCPEWPVAARPYGRTVTAPGAPPILVVGTTGDPATPYESARRLAAQLSSGRLLTLRGVGHTAYRQSACIRGAVDAYLNDGTVPAPGTVC